MQCMGDMKSAMGADPLIAEAMALFASDLNPTLYYRSPAHARDVLRQTRRLAEVDGLDDRH